MISVEQSDTTIFFRACSLPQDVVCILEKTKRFFSQRDICDFHEFSIVQRELLNNALDHGNRFSPDLKILCSIEILESNKVKLIVEDGGKGFCHASLDVPTPNNLKKINRRGYILINAFSENIEFNKKGNRVTVYLTLQNGGIPMLDRKDASEMNIKE